MASHLKFQDVSSQLASTESSNNFFGSGTTVTRGGGTNQTVNIIICSFRIARKKYDCKKGFGACDFKWAWEQKIESTNYINMENVISSPLRTSSTGKYYLLLSIDQKLTKEEIEQMPPFVVDELLERMEIYNGKKQVISVEKGSYKYNPSIGKYGGFEIPIVLENIDIDQ